jgi:hypothetical protein
MNLAFGDWNSHTQSIDDSVATNNNDSDKVLATVAFIVLDFTNRFHGIIIYAAGSTPGRTRKYQMGVNKYYDEICSLFHIFGITEGDNIQPFMKNVNYSGFLVRRKFQ